MNRSFARTQARAFGLVSSLFMVFGLAGPSHADEKSAEVESLFADGKRLIEEGKPALACPKFLASYKLEPRIGTLLNLATCYEKNGQLASAWTRYVEAKPLTRAANQQERYDYANERAAALCRDSRTSRSSYPPRPRGWRSSVTECSSNRQRTGSRFPSTQGGTP